MNHATGILPVLCAILLLRAHASSFDGFDFDRSDEIDVDATEDDPTSSQQEQSSYWYDGLGGRNDNEENQPEEHRDLTSSGLNASVPDIYEVYANSRPSPSPSNATTTGILDTEAIEASLPKEAIGPFRLRMVWTKDACWQGQCKYELDWCMQCEGYYCNEGDILWIEICRNNDQQLFVWIPVEDEDDFKVEQDEEVEDVFDADKKKRRALQKNLMQHMSQSNLTPPQPTADVSTSSPASPPTESLPTRDASLPSTNHAHTAAAADKSPAKVPTSDAIHPPSGESASEQGELGHPLTIEAPYIESFPHTAGNQEEAEVTTTPSETDTDLQRQEHFIDEVFESLIQTESPTEGPEPSSAPSLHASPEPSATPSSSHPTNIPTAYPTTSAPPSAAPTTARPSNKPTLVPTTRPSNKPSQSLSSPPTTALPFNKPTLIPTTLPSNKPTQSLSSSPTTALPFNETTGVPTYTSSNEAAGTQSPTYTQMGVFKVADLSKNLCLDRVHLNRYYLLPCDMSQSQLFYGVPPKDRYDESFEFRPRPMYSIDRVDEKCLNTHHHPRNFEEIINTSCELARYYHTSRWHIVLDKTDTFARNRDKNINTFLNGLDEAPDALTGDPNLYTLLEPRRDPRCGVYSPCGACQGHCSSDDECVGNLRCFERSWDNPVETPPGCHGEGVPRIDYCYAEPGN